MFNIVASIVEYLYSNAPLSCFFFGTMKNP